ncbi:MAG TPA: T9SS type A sorting domain-containing protein [Bacteroidia bacterium]|jgi:hypothetical protein
MTKKLHVIFSLLVVSASGFAQQNDSEIAPFVSTVQTSVSTERALWTVQLDVNPTTISPGIAAACWTGTEFWVAKWANDTMFTLNAAGGITSGPFVIAGLTGVRSITTDGTTLYAGANTSSIFKINPVTKTVIGTITTTVANCRYVTYDPTLNAGAGGFWTGSYGSDITAVSLTGAALSTIAAATHGLTGIYGMAYDPYSTGGPYLWAYDQTGGGMLHQLTMSGTPTGLTHNTQTDLAGGTGTALAGGLFVSNSFVSGMKTIGGVSQGTSLFAYELSDPLSVGSIDGNDFDLSVYPNPSSVASEIRFTIASEDFVALEVYSVLGSVVYKVNAQQLNSGMHSFAIDGSNLENGTYFVKLTVGNITAGSRFIVMK